VTATYAHCASWTSKEGGHRSIRPKGKREMSGKGMSGGGKNLE